MCVVCNKGGQGSGGEGEGEGVSGERKHMCVCNILSIFKFYMSIVRRISLNGFFSSLNDSLKYFSEILFEHPASCYL